MVEIAFCLPPSRPSRDSFERCYSFHWSSTSLVNQGTWLVRDHRAALAQNYGLKLEGVALIIECARERQTVQIFQQLRIDRAVSNMAVRDNFGHNLHSIVSTYMRKTPQ
jgi:hypothetical protein